ncbi:TspO/MBR family protein [Blautia hominis]|uniref:TspO/MBR family protein n=1 Tax=Blautia hominis TaxID=2025493 RepID=UPI0036F28F1E
MNKNNRSALVISILIPLAIGSLSTLVSGNRSMYFSINKPALSPPAFIFPIVWTILYILMGISSYIIYESESPRKSNALRTYAVQLLFNFFWSIIFFGLSQYFFAFLWLLALIILIAVMIYQFYKISPAAAYFQIPYFIWCLFAAYLNFMIYIMNKSVG